MSSGIPTLRSTTPDTIREQYGPLVVRHTKAQIERAAQAAHARGLSPNEACPHPFHGKCGMHWLAAFNLAIPLDLRSIAN